MRKISEITKGSLSLLDLAQAMLDNKGVDKAAAAVNAELKAELTDATVAHKEAQALEAFGVFGRISDASSCDNKADLVEQTMRAAFDGIVELDIAHIREFNVAYLEGGIAPKMLDIINATNGEVTRLILSRFLAHEISTLGLYIEFKDVLPSLIDTVRNASDDAKANAEPIEMAAILTERYGSENEKSH